MFQDNTQGTGVPTVPSATDSLPDHQFEIVRHTLFGTLTAVQNTIKLLHKLNYRSEEHTSELQSLTNLVCRLLLEKKKNK